MLDRLVRVGDGRAGQRLIVGAGVSCEDGPEPASARKPLPQPV